MQCTKTRDEVRVRRVVTSALVAEFETQPPALSGTANE